MAKKQEDPGGEKNTEDSQAAKVSAAAPARKTEEPGFEIGQWRGMKQWRCRHCAFDTLDGEAAMRQHLMAHAPPSEPVGSVVPMYNRQGHRIPPQPADQPAETEPETKEQ